MPDKICIIAEAGVNHNGSIKTAMELIDIAVESGADIVKFQTGKPENVISHKAPKADYQLKSTGRDETQLEMVKKLALQDSDYIELKLYCERKNINFMSTPFDLDSIDLLAKQMDLPQLKLASGEITNAPLLFKAAQTGKKIILSTGMSTLGEVEIALGILGLGYLFPSKKPSLDLANKVYSTSKCQNILKQKITLLHCTTEYPAPYKSVNLRMMDTLKNAFDLPVGLSDHTLGIAVSIAAAARGAIMIEKHFTIDREMNGPDHKASLEPLELNEMVKGIRSIEDALGNTIKIPASAELKNIPIARRSLTAQTNIFKGETFTKNNLTTKRPATGKSSIHYWEWLGKIATRNYVEDELID